MSDHKASPTPQPRDFEAPHALLSRRVAAEGMVLLENSGVLPLSPCRVALFGNGARRTIKGGTGSGDVNERSRVTVEDGLRNAGFVVTGRHGVTAMIPYSASVWKRAVKRIPMRYIWIMFPR